MPVPPKGTTLTLSEIIPYVDAAAAYAKEAGKEKAIAEFNNPDSVFNTGEAYIFAEGMDGTALAEPFEHDIVGKNILDFTDPYGIPLGYNLVNTARSGKGLVSYHYRNPAKNNSIEPKVSYVVNVDGTYYVGAGYYENAGTIFPTAGRSADQQDITRGELVAFVEEARNYALTRTREQALAAFNNQSGPFIQKEMYIIAYDSSDRNLAHPYSPLIRNLSLKHYLDQDSVATIAELAGIAQRGGGFAHTTQQIPVNGTLIFAPKLHYVLPVDNTWWISAAILNPDYTQLRTGNLTGIRIRNQTQEDLSSLVDRAVRYAQENGREKTLAEINKPDGIFVDGNLFVWASDFDGNLLADPFLKDLAGKNQMEYTDAYGEMTTRTGISAITNGTGYVHGMFEDTSAGSGRLIPKLMYMKAVDDTWWIGSGIYGVEVRQQE
jgi:signal transduction histidine kinase